jgi:hypothetical protein
MSLSWFWRKKAEERPVMFLHVPHLVREEQIEEGRVVAICLIKALVESRAELGVRDPLKGVDLEDEHCMDAAEIALGKQKIYQGWDGVS